MRERHFSGLLDQRLALVAGLDEPLQEVLGDELLADLQRESAAGELVGLGQGLQEREERRDQQLRPALERSRQGLRDRETAAMALSSAETGHLILTTLHTRDAKGAVTRFVDFFPTDAQDDVRAQLSLSLRSVVSQHLLPPAKVGERRVLALEVMHVNQPVRSAIRFGKVESIESNGTCSSYKT